MFDIAITLKKTITLLALVDPFLAAPLFASATAQLGRQQRIRFARTLALTVIIGLLVGGLVGLQVLTYIGVSLASMQVAGGLIALTVAMAMVVAKEQAVKLSGHEAAAVTQTVGLVPLGIPLLVGPAALSYVMATSSVQAPVDLFHVVIPPAFVALVTWGVLELTARTHRMFSPSALNVIERVNGFLLAALAVEMMATGLRGLFPTLTA